MKTSYSKYTWYGTLLFFNIYLSTYIYIQRDRPCYVDKIYFAYKILREREENGPCENRIRYDPNTDFFVSIIVVVIVVEGGGVCVCARARVFRKLIRLFRTRPRNWREKRNPGGRLY